MGGFSQQEQHVFGLTAEQRQYGPFSGEANEHDPRLMHLTALNPLEMHNSASRAQMETNHLGQLIVVDGAEPRRMQTGIERAIAPYTFNIKMPENGKVLAVLDRYRRSIGSNSINENPETVLIYEEEKINDLGSKTVGCIVIPKYCSNHQYFGFKYVPQEGMNKLMLHQAIPKDTVFMESPDVKDGTQCYGVECNVAFMTLPGVAEDGIWISRDVLHKFSFKTYETVVVEWGSDKFALNLYGDENVYKPFPDIGEKIRKDGLLMALRENEPTTLAIVEQSIKHTRKVDFTFDDTKYVEGPGGRVVDIRVHHDICNTNTAEVHMDRQVQKYDQQRREFNQRVLDVYNEARRRWGKNLKLTSQFNQLVVNALAVVRETPQKGIQYQKVHKLYRKAPIDTYRVEFVVEYTITPTTGFKLTDRHGGKGVICHIAEPHEMPVDAAGNRADIVMDPNSTVSRMNLGRLYEHLFNAFSRDLHKELCARFGTEPKLSPMIYKSVLDSAPEEVVQSAYSRLLRYYQLLSPYMHAWYAQGLVEETPREILTHVLTHGIYLYMPTNNPPEYAQVASILRKEFPLTKTPVRYTGYSGNSVVTKKPVLIGSMYIILLEKTGDDWSAISSGRFQNFGVLAQQTRADKNSTPTRHQAVRGYGEAETRIVASYCGPEVVAEQMDRNNNPTTHAEITRNLFLAEHPTNVEDLVDRRVHPFGRSKPLQLVKHLLMCAGARFVYTEYDEYWDKIEVAETAH